MNTEQPADLFRGVRVVELAEWVFVPVTGVLLADWGAEVIKIEHPVRGDGYRSLVSAGMHSIDASGVNQAVELANRGKRSIGLDITTGEGRAVLLDLAATADVFMTSFLPPTLERLGLRVEDVRSVNPSIVYAAATDRESVAPMPTGHRMTRRRSGREAASARVSVPPARTTRSKAATPSAIAMPPRSWRSG